MNLALGIIACIILLFGFVVFRGAPYVPSQRKYIKRAFDGLYKVGEKDLLVDIGSGDGLILRLAAARGARAIGYELNPVLVIISRLLAMRLPKVRTILADFWFAKLPNETTIIYIFMVSRDSKRMVKKLQTEVNRIGHPISVMSFGSTLYGLTPDKVLDAYHLYTLRPLQVS